MINDRSLTLYFANDQLRIAEDKEDLGYMLSKLKETYEEVWLQVNLEDSWVGYLIANIVVTIL